MSDHTNASIANTPAPALPVSVEFMQELIQAGVIIGHASSKTHPRMKHSIAGNRNELDLIDPLATLESLMRTGAFLKTLLEFPNSLVLVVGTEPAVRSALRSFAEQHHFPFVERRWLGGTLTNFSMIRSRIRYYEDLKAKREQGDLQKYTKKERIEFDKEISKLSATFDGLALLTRMPDALLVVGIREHMTAVREARKMSIPVVAVIDSDDDPALADYPIVANDHARSSIEWVLGRLERILKGETKVVASSSGGL
jgi:small subunit ribosomal protein S2